MRNPHPRKRLSPLLLGVVLFVAGARAQTVSIAPAVGTIWRFNEADDISADDWTALNYDDTTGSWTEGPSGFAYETGANDVSHTADPATTLIRTALQNPANDPAAVTRHARYFRKKFDWAGATAGATLFLRTRWDDSGVIYLNGQVVMNVTDAIPPLGFTQTTRGAIGAGTEGTVDEIVEVDVSGILQSGQNVLAAEVHQTSATSSDIVFVCAASINQPFAPVLTDTTQPTNRIVIQTRSTTLEVFADGFPALEYQWYFEPDTGAGFNPISGATASLYRIDNMTAANAGSYYCQIRNSLGSVMSRTALVQFSSDDQPPTIVKVTATDTFDKVIVEFSEALESHSAEDLFNYAVNDSMIALTGAALGPDGRTVVLTLEESTPLAEDTLNTVTIIQVTDLVGNEIAPDATVPFRSFALSRFFLNFASYDTGAGNSVDILTAHPGFPDFPRERLFLSAFDTRTVYPNDSHENYGARISGVFIPPTSGNWILYLSSDDSSDMYFNPSGSSAAGKVLINQEPGCCNPFSAHASAPQTLVADQSYFIEVLYKEGTGGDYCRVAAKLESDPTPPNSLAPIPGRYLGHFTDKTGAAVNLTRQPVDQVAPFSDAPEQVGLEEFTSGNTLFSVTSANSPGGPWTFNPARNAWACHDQDPCASAFRASRLNSPHFSVTTTGPVTLTFRHRYSFEADATTRWDGGQVRLSVNGAEYVPVPLASFTANGYNNTVGGGSAPNNDLSGQDAFTADSTGYGAGTFLTSTATLGLFNAGDTVSIQFLAAWDECSEGTEPNWEIDSVQFAPSVEDRRADGPVTFSVEAAASRPDIDPAPIAYQWQRNDGAGFTDITGATSSSFTITPLPSDAGARVRCLVNTPGAGQISDEVTLNVLPRIKVSPVLGTATLSWPAILAGFGLDEASALGTPPETTIWTGVTVAPELDAGLYKVTVATGSGQKFYRLRNPSLP